MKNQETKIDLEVRNACEIVPEEFSVDKELLDRIEAAWAKDFLPRKVRAEPYKIHLYGPGGHFKSHRDTPEMNLVGTFLLGLGDTANRYVKGNLAVGGIEGGVAARPCSWVAFHPDVPHSILPLPKDHYRAVIAFKIFSVPDNSEPTENPIQTSVNEALATMRLPFGIFLDRQYCMGTSKLSGFDTILLAAAYSRKDKCRIYTLPVVTKFQAVRGVADRDDTDEASTKVYPFTEAHIEFLLGRRSNATSEVPWLTDVKDLRFCCLGLDKHTITWANNQDDGAEWTGNESRPASKDSIYLSYSLIVLPDESVEGDKGGK